MTAPDSLDQLRRLIGQRVRHQGIACRVIEILEDGPSLVLLDLEQHTTIQPSQFGDPRRRVPVTYTIPVLTEEREFHADFLALTVESGD